MTDRNALLDVDPSILNNNLLLNGTPDVNEAFLSLLENESRQAPLKSGQKVDLSPQCRLVKPTPGFCIKTWKETGEKFFINICQTDHIPQPKPISDNELMKLLYDDSDSGNNDFADFRIPMSIGNLHTERDKSGQPCEVCDVAVNSEFYNKRVLVNVHFKSFLITLALEGVIDKYSMNINREKEPVVLKHCKLMGKIENQMVQIRDIDVKQNSQSNRETKKVLIEELKTNNEKRNTVSSFNKVNLNIEECPYQILMDAESDSKGKEQKSVTINVLINRRNVLKSSNIDLDIGEDRLLVRLAQDSSLENPDPSHKPILLDIFLPINISNEKSVAHFNRDNKVLTIHAPLAA